MVFVIVAAVLGVIALIQSKFTNLVAWAVICLVMAMGGLSWLARFFQ